MMLEKLPVDQIIRGDCVEVLDTLPENSIDLIFADPPYNLQLHQALWRPNLTRVDAVNDKWDQFDGFTAYDEFTHRWLSACRRVLKSTGTIWVIGTYHNIYRVGAILQDLGFWFLNDIVWVKTNPMPNFRGVRFTNAHETLIWASKSRGAKYTFNHHAMKALNENLQMRSDWLLPICTGPERIRSNGKKAHSTQKPERLLQRVILSSSNPGDVVLDPFFGSGTTGAVAKKLHRRWIGIELDEEYIRVAQQRIDQITPATDLREILAVRDVQRRQPRLALRSLLEKGLLQPGQALYFRQERSQSATVQLDGKLSMDGLSGSIHQTARRLVGGSPCNGWTMWFYEAPNGALHPLNDLRQEFLQQK